jgi:ATP-dependent DNA helicase RecQ
MLMSACRAEYKDLGRALHLAVGRRPVVALTATASEHTVNALKQSLRMSTPTIIRGPLFRRNLYLSVKVKADRSMQLAQLQKELQGCDMLAVVFCNRKHACEDLRKRIQEREPGWRLATFHSGLHAEAREQILQECRDMKMDVLFCTTAFGLGVDVRVRTVLHWDVPQSICQYVQEVGRAGRDGEQAVCRMFVASDWYQKRCREAEKNVGFVDTTVVQAREVQAYISGETCRHEHLLRYFTAPDVQQCVCRCDVCCEVRGG